MISVIVPLAGECPHRARAWEWVRATYEGLEVVEGYGDAQRWIKAEAVADGLSRATGDVLVIADADCWSENLQVSVDAVESGEFKWSSPHRHVRRLTQDGTDQFIAGERETAMVSENHHSVLGGGIVVMRRETYERAPLDPRFIGWGSEDQSWAAALKTLAGLPYIHRAPLWHLWHPPQQRMSRQVGNPENDVLRARYIGARGNCSRMRDLIAEGRKCQSIGSSPRQ